MINRRFVIISKQFLNPGSDIAFLTVAIGTEHLAVI